MRRVIIYTVLLFDVLVALDRVTKWWIMTLPNWESWPSSWFVSVVFHKNFGLIANIPAPRWAMLVSAAVIMSLIGINLIRAIRDERRDAIVPLVLIFAGAVGNAWDRLTLGYVVDWILLFQRSVINLADAYIACGVLGYVLIEFGRHERLNHLDKTHETP